MRPRAARIEIARPRRFRPAAIARAIARIS
jgi:hypothetical protein